MQNVRKLDKVISLCIQALKIKKDADFPDIFLMKVVI